MWKIIRFFLSAGMGDGDVAMIVMQTTSFAILAIIFLALRVLSMMDSLAWAAGWVLIAYGIMRVLIAISSACAYRIKYRETSILVEKPRRFRLPWGRRRPPTLIEEKRRFRLPFGRKKVDRPRYLRLGGGNG